MDESIKAIRTKPRVRLVPSDTGCVGCAAFDGWDCYNYPVLIRVCKGGFGHYRHFQIVKEPHGPVSP